MGILRHNGVIKDIVYENDPQRAQCLYLVFVSFENPS